MEGGDRGDGTGEGVSVVAAQQLHEQVEAGRVAVAAMRRTQHLFANLHEELQQTTTRTIDEISKSIVTEKQKRDERIKQFSQKIKQEGLPFGITILLIMIMITVVRIVKKIR